MFLILWLTLRHIHCTVWASGGVFFLPEREHSPTNQATDTTEDDNSWVGLRNVHNAAAVGGWDWIDDQGRRRC